MPREQFVPLDEILPSTRDEAVRLDGTGEATVSAMHAYARSFTLARVAAGQRVLDLGGGTGYGAALLSRVVGDAGVVVSVELDGALTVKKMEEGDFSGLAAADDGVREVRFDHTITRF